MKLAVFTASVQNMSDKTDCISRHLAVSRTVRFLRSVTPFCSGLYGQIKLLVFPRLFIKSSQLLFLYSVLFIWLDSPNIFSFCFSANAIKFLVTSSGSFSAWMIVEEFNEIFWFCWRLHSHWSADISVRYFIKNIDKSIWKQLCDFNDSLTWFHSKNYSCFANQTCIKN